MLCPSDAMWVRRELPIVVKVELRVAFGRVFVMEDHVSEDQTAQRRLLRPAVEVAPDGDGRYTLVVSGDIDEPFGRVIVDAVNDLVANELVVSIVVDLAVVSVFGSAGVRAVRDLERSAHTSGFSVCFRSASPIVQRVFTMFELDHLLEQPDRPAAADADGDADADARLIESDGFEAVVAQGVLNGRDAVVITTRELELPGPTIVFVNRAFTELFGYAADDVLGETPRMLQGPLTDRAVLDRMKEHFRRGDSFEGDLVNYTADATPFVMSWKVMPVVAPAGHRGFCMSLQRDVTKERRRQRFDMANDLFDTQLRIGSLDLTDPTVPLEQSMSTLLTVHSMMLGAGVATIVLADRNDRDHRFLTATTEAETHRVDDILRSYGRETIDDADVTLDGNNPHLRLDSKTVAQSSYRYARLVLSGVHRDWLRLADVDYHQRLLRRVLSH